MTFRERFMNHETEFDEIFDLTDKWNFSDETCTLREFLGLNAEEEDIWIRSAGRHPKNEHKSIFYRSGRNFIK